MGLWEKTMEKKRVLKVQKLKSGGFSGLTDLICHRNPNEGGEDSEGENRKEGKTTSEEKTRMEGQVKEYLNVAKRTQPKKLKKKGKRRKQHAKEHNSPTRGVNHTLGKRHVRNLVIYHP